MGEKEIYSSGAEDRGHDSSRSDPVHPTTIIEDGTNYIKKIALKTRKYPSRTCSVTSANDFVMARYTCIE
jgi:hypothetical protein